MFGDESVLLKCYNAFLLPCLEYCSPVWCSAADSHLKLLDRVMSSIKFMLPNINVDLCHRRKVSSLCLLHKIYYNNKHPLHSFLPDLAVFGRNTRFAAAANSLTFSRVRTDYLSNQFNRSFLPATIQIWNSLPSAIVECSELQKFKEGANKFLLSAASLG